MRTALVYALLVVAPLVGVAAVMHHGRTLVAPPHVGGTWRVETGAACALPTGTTFRLVQSGRFADVLVGDAPHLHGRVSVDGDLRARGRADACGPLALDARIAGERMSGTLGRAGCEACPAAPVEAVRIPPDAAPGAHGR